MGWNAKVRCIREGTSFHKKDKIYNVIDGRIESESGYFPTAFNDIEDLNNRMRSKFELVEEDNKTCDNCGNNNINKRECQVCTTTEIKGDKQTPNHWKSLEIVDTSKIDEKNVTKSILINKEYKSLISHPKHYTQGKYEPIDVIKDWKLDFDLGNVVKYIARCEHKGNKLQDLKKAKEYLEHEIKSIEETLCK